MIFAFLYCMVTYSNAVYTRKTICLTIITIFAAITTINSSSLFLLNPLQQMQLIQNRNNHGTDFHAAFAYHGQEISQTLNYAHFLPLTGNNQSHQVKVVVNYSVTDPSVVNQNMNAIMHVYAPNGTLVRSSSFGHGFIISSTSGQSQLATTLTNNTLKNVKADVIFTDAAKSANFSKPLGVNLSLGQKIPPP
jgi:hypothetical protein